MAEEQKILHVSLIPEEGEIFKPVNLKRRKFLLAVFCFLCLTLVGVSVAALRNIAETRSSERSGLQAQIDKIKQEAEGATAQYENVSRLGRKLVAARSLLSSHPSFGSVFALLEERTIPEVYYSNFIGSFEGKNAVLEARAKDFNDVARQLVAFREAAEGVSKAATSAISADIAEDGSIREIKFTLSLALSEKAFK